MLDGASAAVDVGDGGDREESVIVVRPEGRELEAILVDDERVDVVEDTISELEVVLVLLELEATLAGEDEDEDEALLVVLWVWLVGVDEGGGLGVLLETGMETVELDIAFIVLLVILISSELELTVLLCVDDAMEEFVKPRMVLYGAGVLSPPASDAPLYTDASTAALMF